MDSKRKLQVILLLLCLLQLLQIQNASRLIMLRKRRAIQKERKRLQRSAITRSPRLQYKPVKVWTLAGWNDADCFHQMRFYRADIYRLIRALRIPNTGWRFNYDATAEEAFCLLLFRLSYPRRLKDCINIFGKSESWCSTIFNDVALFLVSSQMDRLEWNSDYLSLSRLQGFASAVERACGVEKVWGFVDGTHRPIAIPIDNQKPFFSGHKKQHGIKFQGITTPDGLITLHGPYKGTRGDWKIWEESGYEDRLRAVFDGAGLTPNEHLYLYGDPAYTFGYGVMGPFRPIIGRRARPLTKDQVRSALHSKTLLTKVQRAANVTMSAQRITIEWAFGLITKDWTFVDMKRSQKIGLSPVAAYYIVATLLTNLQTCLRQRNIISDQYDISPPTLEEYLGIDIAI